MSSQLVPCRDPNNRPTVGREGERSRSMKRVELNASGRLETDTSLLRHGRKEVRNDPLNMYFIIIV